eukprot:TRINITY_DN3413_c0_g3_i2.p1 TRINITY_DN3413_c0_g3~~TRINITY_DN3413_c0_g3_i2.p1  ORF type:complete len:149 (-),score=10.44 TRINITY_DN3413_c0_g3_i2:239-685(-)
MVTTPSSCSTQGSNTDNLNAQQDQKAVLKQIPVALLTYGFLSASIYIVLGTTCYFSRPSRFFGNFIQRFPTIKNYQQKIYTAGLTKAAQNFSWLNRFGNYQKVSVAVAESLAISTMSKPVVVPFKLWIAWNVTKQFQQNQITTKPTLQ